jgi:FtsP/CotA-like multicopper oxidase with cupredoxin domain
MKTSHRLALLAAAAAVIAVLFVALRPDDSDEAAPTPTTTTATAAGSTTAPKAAAKPKPPRPEWVYVHARGLKPVGGVKRITVKKGDTVRIAVISDTDEEAHLHGYDLSREIGPGKVGRYRFKADIDGIFELELENAGVQIAELRVEP